MFSVFHGYDFGPGYWVWIGTASRGGGGGFGLGIGGELRIHILASRGGAGAEFKGAVACESECGGEGGRGGEERGRKIRWRG